MNAVTVVDFVFNDTESHSKRWQEGAKRRQKGGNKGAIRVQKGANLETHADDGCKKGAKMGHKRCAPGHARGKKGASAEQSMTAYNHANRYLTDINRGANVRVQFVDWAVKIPKWT